MQKKIMNFYMYILWRKVIVIYDVIYDVNKSKVIKIVDIVYKLYIFCSLYSPYQGKMMLYIHVLTGFKIFPNTVVLNDLEL